MHTANLFCDGEINCGFNEADFGTDEKNCEGGSTRQGKSGDEFFSSDRPASLYVFAITCVVTLIVVVALVVVACCCLRKFANLRGQHSGSNSSLPQDILEFHMGTTSISGYEQCQVSLLSTFNEERIVSNLCIIDPQADCSKSKSRF
jgi:hypothetical protein